MPIADGTGLGIGVAIFIIILIIAISIGSLVFFIMAIIDIAKRPDWQWKMAGQEKILWLLLVILVNFLAIPSLIYWAASARSCRRSKGPPRRACTAPAT
jgi:hypothetical protein